MNHSLYSADRSTHMKIVAAALVLGIGVAGLGIAARINTDDGYSQTTHVIKAKDGKFALACRRTESFESIWQT